MTNRPSLALVFFLAVGCTPSPYGLSQGEQCELNSDCDAPLVCRIGYCRRECSTSRDCAAGLDCVEDNSGLGACQLPRETSCVRDSDCPESLVCTMGECTNECGCPDGVPCVDCPPGATCIGRPDGTRACLDPSTRTCVWNSDCAATDNEFVCAFDQRCRIECRIGAEDCRFGDRCVTLTFDEGDAGVAMGNFCVPQPAATGTDAGTADAASSDAGTADAASSDADTTDDAGPGAEDAGP